MYIFEKNQQSTTKQEKFPRGQSVKAVVYIYSWVGLVSKNYEIERACVELEKELAELESKHRQKKVSHSYKTLSLV